MQPENIVLVDNQSRDIKIIDFGTAVKIKPGSKVDQNQDCDKQKPICVTGSGDGWHSGVHGAGGDQL